MKGVRVFLSFLICFFLSFNFSFGKSLEDVVRELGGFSTPQQIEKAINSLNSTDRLKLEILLSAYRKDEERLKALLSSFRRSREKYVIANAIFFPSDRNVIVVDKEKEILYVLGLKKGLPFIVKKFPCITGKRAGDKLREGDQRTPEGIYFPLFWSDNLPSTYGIGAFPLNYPNLIDRKILHRNGHGIWIHGTDNPNRPPHSSNGCIVLRNNYLSQLLSVVKPKETPVIIVESLQYYSPERYFAERQSLLDFINRWKSAWERTPKNLVPYFSCYSEHFVWKGGGIKSWKDYKRRVTSRKKWIRIKIDNLYLCKDGRVLKYGNIYVASFKMTYNSNNYHFKGEKVLYIIKEGKRWKILGEETL
jgi:murein L,D-transpeptidase YafK